MLELPSHRHKDRPKSIRMMQRPLRKDVTNRDWMTPYEGE